MMMDELVQDLVSALEQTSEQSKLGGLWEEMVLNPLHQRRQIRRRRSRKRHRASSFYPLEHRRCWIEASESSLDEASKNRRANATAAFAANCSDSDDMPATSQWHTFMRGPTRTRQPSWPESDSFSENNPARPLRRRRKVKRVTADVGAFRLQQNLKGMEGKLRQRPSRMQHLARSKSRSGGWADRKSEGARLMGKEHWKRKMTLEAKEHRDGADENMSEGESSSTCSSDPGLFTNDEGRQGDDEQSDWFFESDCGSGVASLLPGWDSDTQLSLDDTRPSPTFLQPARLTHRGYRSRLKRLPGSAACCLRKDRRRLPSKRNTRPVYVERLRQFSQDCYQRDFWLPSVVERDRNQLNPLCPFPVCPIVKSEAAHLRCSSSLNRSRQSSVTLGLFCTGDIRRWRKTDAASFSSSAASPHHQREEARGSGNTFNLESLGASGGPSPSTPHCSSTTKTESPSYFHNHPTKAAMRRVNE
ncbi:G patch domain-containing protein 2-like isoform 2-T3 [Synchiropus picturatus]